jgi:hypothetical protein
MARIAGCEDCLAGKVCWEHLFLDPRERERRDEISRYRHFISIEEADQKYADDAREHSVNPQHHKDGFCQYWQSLRYRRLVLCNRKCEAPGCNNAASDCHHLHYDTLGFEEIDDVRMLCRECHDAQHGTFKPTRPRGFYAEYLDDIGEKRRAAGIPDPPETHDDKYWDERRKWNDQKSMVTMETSHAG